MRCSHREEVTSRLALNNARGVREEGRGPLTENSCRGKSRQASLSLGKLGWIPGKGGWNNPGGQSFEHSAEILP